MRGLTFLSLVFLVFLWPAADQGRAEVNVGVSVEDGCLKTFHLAIGEHYNVPEKEIIVVRERKIPDDELPVVFFIAGRAGVKPEAIIKLRLGGKSWMAISAQYGLTAEVFYVPVKSSPGPPYGNAFGHYKKRKKAEWGKIQLADSDVVNLVNLKFISEHYGCSPDEVIRMREKGSNFAAINAEVKKNKGQAKKKASQQASSDKQQKKGKGKGKKK
ncbi:MAG: hypothetical protein JSU69_09280 [Candidatus Zixiibacteriota bacterium]|nr:MAG: hypothetical protein JSU69_09280 [candidate division Zixibacteria bacterium]